MSRKNLLRTILVLAIFMVSVAILRSANRTSADQNCTESIEDCCKKQKNTSPSGEMLWESLPSRFFSNFGF